MKVTLSKKKYIKEWCNYIDGLSPLCFTKDYATSDQVLKHINELKILVVKVADSKNLK